MESRVKHEFPGGQGPAHEADGALDAPLCIVQR
jgi:hypothetical protein